MKQQEETMEEQIKKLRCHDCGVLVGEIHHEGCDVEECPKCQRQLIGCDCYSSSLPFPERIRYGKETRVKFYHGEYKSIIDFIHSEIELALKEERKICQKKDKYGELYEIDLINDPEKKALYVKVIDSTEKTTYWLRVDPNCRPMLEDGKFGKSQELTAKNAVASTFGMKGENYNPIIQT